MLAQRAGTRRLRCALQPDGIVAERRGLAEPDLRRRGARSRAGRRSPRRRARGRGWPSAARPASRRPRTAGAATSAGSARSRSTTSSRSGSACRALARTSRTSAGRACRRAWRSTEPPQRDAQAGIGPVGVSSTWMPRAWAPATKESSSPKSRPGTRPGPWRRTLAGAGVDVGRRRVARPDHVRADHVGAERLGLVERCGLGGRRRDSSISFSSSIRESWSGAARAGAEGSAAQAAATASTRRARRRRVSVIGDIATPRPDGSCGTKSVRRAE